MVVTEKWASFIQIGVSIVIGSRDDKNVPCVVRGLGCRMSPDRSQVTVLAAKTQAGVVLDAVRATRTLAVVFSQPTTHTTIQLKAADAMIGKVLPTDAALYARYRDAFAADCSKVGYPELGIQTLLWCDTKDLVAITFTPHSAFLQTPGPHAGEPLED